MCVRERVTITVSYMVRSTKTVTADHDNGLFDGLEERRAIEEPPWRLRPVNIGRIRVAMPVALDIGRDRI